MTQLPLFGLGAEHKALWFGVLLLSLKVYVVGVDASDVPIGRTYRFVSIFLAADVVRLTLLVAIPTLLLWLVRFDDQTL